MATLALNLAIGFASSFLSNLLAPSSSTTSTIKQEGPRLNDLSAPKSSYGGSIPRIYGTVRVAGNAIWASNIRETVNTEQSYSGGGGRGGKGGGGGGGGGTITETTTYTYNGSFAVLLGEGQITGIKRIWLNSKLVYNIAPDADADTYNRSQIFAGSIRVYTGVAHQQDSLIAGWQGSAYTPAYRGRSYIVFVDIPLEEWGNRLPVVSAEVVQYGYFSGGRLYSVPISLGAIAQDICSRVGFDPSDLDTTEVGDIQVEGFWTNTNISARDALAQLQKVFFFDVVESGGKLKFIKQVRPGSPIAIPITDLATHEYGQQRPDNFNSIRTQDTEILDEVSVTYLDLNFAYQQASQSAKRQISPNKNKNDLKFDIVLNASTALAVAQKILYLGWAQRRKFSFTLPLKYAVLEPGDVVSVPVFNNEPLLIYILKINIGANFLLECEGIPYEPSLINLTATATAPAVLLSLPNPGNTDLRLLDIPLIRDEDVDLGIYVAPTGNAAWRNAALYVSRNGGNSYQYAKALLTKSIVGSCNSILGNSSEFLIDRKNSLSVTINSGELESITDIDFYNGRNCALVGQEIIYFKTAILVEPNTYILSELLRGRRGTEWAIASHNSNEEFILLTGYIERVAGDILDLNLQRQYKAPIPGQSLDDLSPTPFTSTGSGLKPYSPCHIRGMRDNNGNLTITWIRRTRKGGLLVDYQDVPLSEDKELYSIDILMSSMVVRNFLTPYPTITYTAADQVIDFGIAQATVLVSICQMSVYVGRGNPGIATI